MARKRGDNGRYLGSSSGCRDVTKSFRVTAANAEKLKQLMEERELTLADLIEEWIEKDDSDLGVSDVARLKRKAIKAFCCLEKVGEQSQRCKNFKKVLNTFTKEI